MSDEIIVNGGTGAGDGDVEIAVNEEDSDSTTNPNAQKLIQKISILEQEKQELINSKESAAMKIKQLEDEIERSESDRKALSSIAARAAQLETEVSRLQHDLISSMTDGQDSNNELSELKRVVEELKNRDSENTEKIDVITKERNLLFDRLNEDDEKLKESENQIRDLERKIEDFDASERFRVDEEAKVKINEKDEQIQTLKSSIKEFESIVTKNHVDLEQSKKENQELGIGKNDLELLLKKSDNKVKEMEHKVDQLRNELEEFQKINSVLKEKMVEDVNGIGNRDTVVNGVNWPMVAATSAGVITTVAVVYFRRAKF